MELWRKWTPILHLTTIDGRRCPVHRYIALVYSPCIKLNSIPQLSSRTWWASRHFSLGLFVDIPYIRARCCWTRLYPEILYILVCGVAAGGTYWVVYKYSLRSDIYRIVKELWIEDQKGWPIVGISRKWGQSRRVDSRTLFLDQYHRLLLFVQT